MRIMYDAVTPTNIPLNAQMVAGYDDGYYVWSQASWNRFPNAVHVHINTQARYLTGQVLDVETGDATPAQALGWVQARRSAGAIPTVYCNRSTLVLVKAVFSTAGVPEPLYWIATDSGVQGVLAGAIAEQYLLDTNGVDISAVADFWPGVDSGYISPTQEDDDMAILAPAATDDYVAVPCNGKPALFVSCGFNRRITVISITAVKDTQGSGATYTTAKQTAVIDPDRPGPIPLGGGCRVVMLRYRADHPFTAWCA